jgi:alpha-1,3-rhamnosyl/mannosyltransferase
VAVGSFRVGFDGHALASPAAGVRRYVTELFTAMGRLLDAPELLALGAPAAAPLPPGVRAVRAVQCLPTNLGWSVSGLPLAVWRSGAGVFHAPAYTAPLWGAVPTVLTIHDVSYARHPEWYPYRLDPVRLAFYRRSAAAASAIVTDSAFSRDEIVAAYGVPITRVRVVPLGVSDTFRPDPSPAPEAQPPYLLHVGDLHPRRNVALALEATLRLRASVPGLRALRLKLAGVDRGSGAALQARARATDPDSLEILGSVPDAELAGLYRSALALIYPSRYEGFGLPVLEAMACGAPVVAARAGSIPEVAGPAGILVDPDDVDGFVAAVLRVATDEAFARGLRAAALDRAREFSWARTAAATVEVYREAMAESRAGAVRDR